MRPSVSQPASIGHSLALLQVAPDRPKTFPDEVNVGCLVIDILLRDLPVSLMVVHVG